MALHSYVQLHSRWLVLDWFFGAVLRGSASTFLCVFCCPGLAARLITPCTGLWWLGSVACRINMLMQRVIQVFLYILQQSLRITTHFVNLYVLTHEHVDRCISSYFNVSYLNQTLSNSAEKHSGDSGQRHHIPLPSGCHHPQPRRTTGHGCSAPATKGGWLQRQCENLHLK